MDAYRCRVCGHTSSHVSEIANCGHCGAASSMIPNTPRASRDVVTMPRDCPEHVIEAFVGTMDAGDVAALYAKFVRLARIP
jgi:hypothetical protein